jgi:hypothetical protein
MGGRVWGGGILQPDATQICLLGPIPAKARKLGLLSIYKFSRLPGSIVLVVSLHSKGSDYFVYIPEIYPVGRFVFVLV